MRTRPLKSRGAHVERGQMPRFWRSISPSGRLLAWLCVVVIASVGVLAGIFFRAAGPPTERDAPARFPYVVGQPGPGSQAPELRLASTAGRTFDLGRSRGTTLLYFMEGVMCEPCWDQLADIERNFSRFRALGIDRIVSIDCDPVGISRRKLVDEGLKSEVLYDPHEVMFRYRTNEYGMMGDGMNGHSFVLVGPDGTIEWRADYGGSQTGYTMYVPVDSLLADIRDGPVRTQARGV